MGLCPVCWWEDDGQEDADASDVRLTVNGQLSLIEAREHFGSAAPRIRVSAVTFASPMSLSSNVHITVLLRRGMTGPV